MDYPHTVAFGATLEKLIKKHRLTISALGEQLGSTVTLRRALSETLSDNKRQEVYEGLCQLQLFSPEEEKLLAEGLEISRLGLPRYLYLRSLDRLIDVPPEPVSCAYQLANGQRLADYLQQLDSRMEISILCVNSLFEPLLSTFRSLLNNPARNITIEHFVAPSLPDKSLSEYLRHAGDLIFDTRYQIWIPGDPFVHASHLPVNGNLLIVRTKSRNAVQEVYFTLLDNEQAVPFALDCTGVYEYYHNLLHYPLNARALRAQPHRPSDYASVCLDFLGYELNRKTVILTPDLTLTLLPPAMIRTAFADNDPKLSDALLDRLESFHSKRYQYVNCTHKSRILIASKAGIERFLQTGILSDRNQCMRVLHPKERLAMLETILYHTSTNNKLVFNLLKDDARHIPYHIRCHDKLGVTLINPSPVHDKQLPYVTLMSASLAAEMNDYLHSCFLEKNCYTGDESLRILQQLKNKYQK